MEVIESWWRQQLMVAVKTRKVRMKSVLNEVWMRSVMRRGVHWRQNNSCSISCQHTSCFLHSHSCWFEKRSSVLLLLLLFCNSCCWTAFKKTDLVTINKKSKRRRIVQYKAISYSEHFKDFHLIIPISIQCVSVACNIKQFYTKSKNYYLLDIYDIINSLLQW